MVLNRWKWQDAQLSKWILKNHSNSIPNYDLGLLLTWSGNYVATDLNEISTLETSAPLSAKTKTKLLQKLNSEL